MNIGKMATAKACMMVCDMNLNSQRTGQAVKPWRDKYGGQCGQGWLGDIDTAEWPVSICPLGSYSREPVTEGNHTSGQVVTEDPGKVHPEPPEQVNKEVRDTWVRSLGRSSSVAAVMPLRSYKNPPKVLGQHSRMSPPSR